LIRLREQGTIRARRLETAQAGLGPAAVAGLQSAVCCTTIKAITPAETIVRTLFLASAMLALLACGETSAQAQLPSPSSSDAAGTPTACPALLKQRFNRLQDDAPQDLCNYAGKVVLVVNTASYCGFTGQYEGLEKLHATYAPKGLVVLGFPSNDFGGQEPGDSKQIADFCYNTYGVKFPMFAKSSVRGKEANPLHARLAEITGTAPKWNFHKYLIDRNGKVVDNYSSLTAPDDRKLVSAIEKALAQKM
jgi:glutathione peroxidase